MEILNNKHSFFKVIMTLFILTLAIGAQAQSGEMANMTAEEKAQLLTDKQNEKLSFYDDQEEKMYDLNLKYAEEMETIMAGGRSMSTLQKLKDMSKRKDKEVKEVLDKDQYKTYEDMKEEMRSQMKAKRKSGR